MSLAAFLLFRLLFKSNSHPMPYAAPKLCATPGCNATTHGRYCAEHTVTEVRVVQQLIDRRRGSASARGYNGRWRRVTKLFLLCTENVLCACGCGRPSEVVDHKIPHRGDQFLFWDQSNWQGMTKRCHDSKTAREDGRWG